MLPDDVTVCILSEWCEVETVFRLDNSVCNRKDRNQMSRTFQHPACSVSHALCREHHVWLNQKKIKLRKLSVFDGNKMWMTTDTSLIKLVSFVITEQAQALCALLDIDPLLQACPILTSLIIEYNMDSPGKSILEPLTLNNDRLKTYLLHVTLDCPEQLMHWLVLKLSQQCTQLIKIDVKPVSMLSAAVLCELLRRNKYLESLTIEFKRNASTDSLPNSILKTLSENKHSQLRTLGMRFYQRLMTETLKGFLNLIVQCQLRLETIRILNGYKNAVLFYSIYQRNNVKRDKKAKTLHLTQHKYVTEPNTLQFDNRYFQEFFSKVSNFHEIYIVNDVAIISIDVVEMLILNSSDTLTSFQAYFTDDETAKIADQLLTEKCPNLKKCNCMYP